MIYQCFKVEISFHFLAANSTPIPTSVAPLAQSPTYIRIWTCMYVCMFNNDSLEARALVYLLWSTLHLVCLFHTKPYLGDKPKPPFAVPRYGFTCWYGLVAEAKNKNKASVSTKIIIIIIKSLLLSQRVLPSSGYIFP